MPEGLLRDLEPATTADMKRRTVFAMLGIFACFVISLVWISDGILSGSTAPVADESGRIELERNEVAGNAPLRTKVSDRTPPLPRPTHRPDQLRDFMLPEMEIEGLVLESALAKLKAAYEEACRFSGETPHQLVFDVPSGGDPLHLRLSARNLDGSIRLLGAVAGFHVQRQGAEYRFTKIEENRKLVKRTLEADPNLRNARILIADLTAQGLRLDPSTRVLLGADGRITLETMSAADEAAVMAIFDLDHSSFQHELEMKVIELQAGMDWTPPEGASLDPEQEMAMLRELTQRRGVDLLTTPTIMARNAQPATIELVREHIVPSETGEGGFETHDVGVIVLLQPSALGFGHQVDLNFREAVADYDQPPGSQFYDRTHITDAGFSANGASRLLMQTREDGSRVLVLLKPTLMDVTGRPAARR